jgi:hypothetical protein
MTTSVGQPDELDNALNASQTMSGASRSESRRAVCQPTVQATMARASPMPAI